MSISVGTIVTRYHPNFYERTCDNGTCVGKVVAIEDLPDSPENPAIMVKWWETCKFHNYARFTTYRFLLDETWEIGQIPNNVH